MWFRHKLRERRALAEERAQAEGRLVLEVSPQLSARLRRAARAQDQTPEALVAELLTRGLEQEALRLQVEAALRALTSREQDVVWLAARGYTNRRIAESLVISSETVKTHVRHVLDKLGVRSKAEMRLLLLDLGIRWWEG